MMDNECDSTLQYYINNSKRIRINKHTYSSPSDNINVDILDAKVANRRIEESEYLRDDEMRSRLRRGNTILTLHTAGGRVHVLGRRGLPKFFDIRHSHIKYMTDPSTSLSQDHSHEYRVTLKECVEILKNNEDCRRCVDVYRTSKANGENCQVSYVQETDSWIVCSKNVSMLVQREEDMERYGGERYEYAKKMCGAWMRMVKRAPDLNTLKQVMSVYTAVGEYCGNKNLQHFVKYPEETILFYALVDKRGPSVCLPPSSSYSILKSVGLDTVSCSLVSSSYTTQSFVDSISSMYHQVAHQSMDQCGEGCVVYMVVRGMEGGERVVSAAKLKTMEYRVSRKMREKVKMMVERGWTKSETLSKYVRAVKETLKEGGEWEGEKEVVGEYRRLCSAMIDVVGECGGIDGKRIHNRYIDIIDVCRLCVEGSRKVSKEEVERIMSEEGGAGEEENAGKGEEEEIEGQMEED